MKIVFYNHWHNGDIHFSREFIKDIITKLPEHSYIYAHLNNPFIIKEIPFQSLSSFPFLNSNDSILKKDNTLFINTWCGQSNKEYVPKDQADIYCLYKMYSDLIRKADLSMDLNDIDSYVPEIIGEDISLPESKFKILFCNNFGYSNQSYNLNYNSEILDLAKEFKEVIFFTTKRVDVLPNIIYTDDIISKDGESNLNRISLLSNQCNLIFGQGSGPSCFTITKHNLQNKLLTYISLVKPWFEKQYFYFAPEEYIQANIIHTNKESALYTILREEIYDKCR